MRHWGAVLAGLLVACAAPLARAGSGTDTWGQDTLTNYPAGQARKTVPAQANDNGVADPIDLPCQCSDADPRDSVTGRVTYSCYFQRHFNGCGNSFMFDANAELAPEGFCQMSCSRCNCCGPVTDAAASLGANRFLQALDAASPSLKDALANPGFTSTILIPTDAAFETALQKYGPLLQDPAVLQQVLKLHIVPPEPVRRGLWTSPMLSLGPKLYTLFDGNATLSVPKFDLPAGTKWTGGVTGYSVSGPYNSAKVVKSDVWQACKSVIMLVDTVLLPFDPAAAPAANAGAASAVVGAGSCAVQANGLITGSELKAGDANRQPSVGACCDSCRGASQCNAFQYCALRGGCHMPDGSARAYGYCALLRSPDVAAGTAPAYSDLSSVTVPLISGYIPAPPSAAGR